MPKSTKAGQKSKPSPHKGAKRAAVSNPGYRTLQAVVPCFLKELSVLSPLLAEGGRPGKGDGGTRKILLSW